MKLTSSNRIEVMRHLIIYLWVIIAIFPMFWVIMNSFKLPADLTAIPPKIFFEVTGEHYARVVEERFFFYLTNSVFVTGMSVLVSLIIGVPAAYGLSRSNMRGRNGILFFLLSIRFVPYIVFAIPMFLIMSRLNLVGTRVGLVSAYLLLNLPVIIWLMKGFFDDIPTDLEQAAFIDGASSFQAFTRIVLPSVAPGLSSVTIFSIIFSWNEYLFPLILSGRDAQPLTVGITRFLGGLEWGVRWGPLSAWASAIIIPVVIVAMVFNRYLREGFTKQNK